MGAWQAVRSCSVAFRAYLGCLAFSVFGLTLGSVTGVQPIWLARVVALVTLVLAVILVLRPITQTVGARAWRVVVGVLLVGSASELIGLYTGFPFGHYEYTQKWWPVLPLPADKFFPVQLPFAWFMMAGASFFTATRWLKNDNRRAAVALKCGLIAACADFVMEYAMVRSFDYWRWPGTSGWMVAPIANFFGWFVVSALAGWILGSNVKLRQVRTWEPEAVLAAHTAFSLFVYIVLTMTNRGSGQ